MGEHTIIDNLPPDVAEQVRQRVCELGPSYSLEDYVRALIIQDLRSQNQRSAEEDTLEGFRDLAAGRVIKSQGNFEDDLKEYEKTFGADEQE